MKIYHTKTIEDFNDLISKLYEEGYSFKDGTPLNFWSLYGCQTGVEFKKFKVGESSKIEKIIYLHNIEYYAVLNYVGVEEILEYKADLGAKATFNRSINMKTYHTETQEDYDALMIELEGKGCKWASGDNPSGINMWRKSQNLTCVDVCDSKITYASLCYYKEEHPRVPIIKYKAKVDEKMRFTKENVEKVMYQHLKETEDSVIVDIVSDIYDMDDTPEKVVVPKFVADWIERNEESEESLQIMLKCYQDYYYNINRNCQTDAEKAVQWYMDNPYKFIQAYEKGYTIEPEQLYYIPLPGLETADGTQQVLTKRENFENYFASRPTKYLKQRYTKQELTQVPEIYKPFAKPIEEEEE